MEKKKVLKQWSRTHRAQYFPQLDRAVFKKLNVDLHQNNKNLEVAFGKVFNSVRQSSVEKRHNMCFKSLTMVCMEVYNHVVNKLRKICSGILRKLIIRGSIKRMLKHRREHLP
jgi:hypothetical protein